MTGNWKDGERAGLMKDAVEARASIMIVGLHPRLGRHRLMMMSVPTRYEALTRAAERLKMEMISCLTAQGMPRGDVLKFLEVEKRGGRASDGSESCRGSSHYGTSESMGALMGVGIEGGGARVTPK